MRVLVACEFSGVVRRAFRERGHDAWSCDLLPAEDESPFHFEGDVRKHLTSQWDLMIAHPPCTYLCFSGSQFLKDGPFKRKLSPTTLIGQSRRDAMKEAISFFRDLLSAPIPRIAVENPMPYPLVARLIGRPHSQIIQPYEFGHGEKKTTYLWLHNLPPLFATMFDLGRVERIHFMGNVKGNNRGKERSRTYPGIAAAMASQWGTLT